jgi:proton-dependent oligopeptide transporter, POT family
MLDRLMAFFRSLAGFSRPFWAANVSELFERVAFYGMSFLLVRYLIQARGLDESSAIRVNGYLGGLVYGLPVVSGIFADWLGYRRAMIFAYLSLGIGYVGITSAPGLPLVFAALFLIAIGASVIKPAITGTVQRTCNDQQLPVGFSIYYMLVNVGGFLGPNIAGQVAASAGLAAAFPASALAIGIALVVVLLFYRDSEGQADVPRRQLGTLARDFIGILLTPRLVVLFVLVAGFWSLFFQFAGALTTYLGTDLGLDEQRSNFIISLDAGLIVLFQVAMGYVTRRWATSRAVWIGALVGAVGIAIIGLKLSPWFAAAGIAVFAIGEMIYSAHFYKYLGSLAPKGQEAMYLGFAFLPISLGSIISGWIGGPIATWARTSLQRPEKMFWAFAAIGLVAALGLWAHATFYGKRDAATA